MNITHLSAECYPIAKVGGLADVVGALPKYQNELGANSRVIMPFYNNAYTSTHQFHSIYNSVLNLGETTYEYQILKLQNEALEFDIFFVHVPELLFKDYVYSAEDTLRFLAFQIGALDWIIQQDELPEVIHCHDHHTGLVPFMMKESYKYAKLQGVPSILTIHNAQYQGWFSHDLVGLIPEFNFVHVGLLDWYSVINPLASAIKCAWRVTTVSPSYMEELKASANGLEALLRHEYAKCIGILNGIDTEVWNPETDSYVIKNYNIDTIAEGKESNKAWICKEFNLDINKPLIAFIGRLVHEKGSDLFPGIFDTILQQNNCNILLLGSGNSDVELQLNTLKPSFAGIYNTFIGYDEKLSHIIYAGADFLLMPSRVEPCGLNQMYSLRYGTIPIVNKIGGLKDTVIDINTPNGFGICHDGATPAEICNAINRAVAFYDDPKFTQIRREIMTIDHSWHASAKAYLNLYNSLKPAL
ncbi:glycogen synthase [Formosa sp. S-31]|uniref:glycogen synthase n=1 Tax=Formosa sp. S-31 TaxID=2790949 RepID=UPI003EB83EC2